MDVQQQHLAAARRAALLRATEIEQLAGAIVSAITAYGATVKETTIHPAEAYAVIRAEIEKAYP
jgi:hypothetical protein